MRCRLRFARSPRSRTRRSVVVGKLQESTETNYGYDAQKNEFTDMVKSGINRPGEGLCAPSAVAASVAGM